MTAGRIPNWLLERNFDPALVGALDTASVFAASHAVIGVPVSNSELCGLAYRELSILAIAAVEWALGVSLLS